jgi:hypothetical protein
MTDAAKSISRCSGEHSRCRNRLCIVCSSLRAIGERHNLKRRLRSIYEVNSKAVLWSSTPTMLDTAVRHREKALGLVAAVRTLMKSLPVTEWFACTEVGFSSLGDASLNIHAHAVMVLEPPKAGRSYIRQGDWPEAIEEAWQTASHYAIDCAPRRLVTPTDALSWASHMTKPANFTKYAATVSEQLKSPGQFLEQAEALHRVARYFGTMASGRKPHQTIH